MGIHYRNKSTTSRSNTAKETNTNEQVIQHSIAFWGNGNKCIIIEMVIMFRNFLFFQHLYMFIVMVCMQTRTSNVSVYTSFYLARPKSDHHNQITMTTFILT